MDKKILICVLKRNQKWVWAYFQFWVNYPFNRPLLTWSWLESCVQIHLEEKWLQQSENNLGLDKLTEAYL